MPLLCAVGACPQPCAECGPPALPPWTVGGAGRLECDTPRLRYAQPLAAFRCFASLRHLRLDTSDSASNDHDARFPPPSVTAADLSDALHALRLQSLGLADPDPNLDRPLIHAIFGSDTLSDGTNGDAQPWIIEPIGCPSSAAAPFASISPAACWHRCRSANGGRCAL